MSEEDLDPSCFTDWDVAGAFVESLPDTVARSLCRRLLVELATLADPQVAANLRSAVEVARHQAGRSLDDGD